MNILDNYDVNFWNEKVKKVSEISKRYGYDERNEEYWRNDKAGTISLIMDIYKQGKTRILFYSISSGIAGLIIGLIIGSWSILEYIK